MVKAMKILKSNGQPVTSGDIKRGQKVTFWFDEAGSFNFDEVLAAMNRADRRREESVRRKKSKI